ncbi:hypothetical protein GCM10023321_00010 [Pseudonocardia eucalypti]|uniref:PA domain-containing protein n=1 Tax=Pseudonocardia eucalypti TaxID=648755 RepID=A0ABP9PF93_9PSEU|nr:Zn-dependent M28 family amino/carboxypeptidase [Pseudonocardia eucalypti]
MPRPTSRLATARFIAVIAGGIALLLVLAVSAGDSFRGLFPERADEGTAIGVRAHLAALQRIADDNGGNRSMGTPGYAASVEYVRKRLVTAGYQVQVQTFRVPRFVEVAPPVLGWTRKQYRPQVDMRTMTYSPSGDVTAPVVGVDLKLPAPPTPDSSSGCQPADFTGFARGSIALVQRGGCPFTEKARNAQGAGAAAVLVMNEGQPDRTAVFGGTLAGPEFRVPVLALDYQVGAELAGAAAGPDRPVVHVATRTSNDNPETQNIVADLPGGRPDRVVTVGAHLDSVPEGPGINDDGSGVATLLDLAERLSPVGAGPSSRPLGRDPLPPSGAAVPPAPEPGAVGSGPLGRDPLPSSAAAPSPGSPAAPAGSPAAPPAGSGVAPPGGSPAAPPGGSGVAPPPVPPRNHLRFAFFGAEELGLLGSEHYVATLPAEERARLMVYLNFDMLGSPNYARFVYSGGSVESPAPPGSDAVTKVFTDHFDAVGLTYTTTPLDGRSDYGPFAGIGVPVGGLFSGGEEEKSRAMADRYGGEAGVAFDRCYHQACDTERNISDRSLAELGAAAEHAVRHFAAAETSPRPGQ